MQVSVILFLKNKFFEISINKKAKPSLHKAIQILTYTIFPILTQPTLFQINDNEYEFKFGLLHGKCSAKKAPSYSGLFGLAPEADSNLQDESFNILSGLKKKTENSGKYF